MDAVRYTDEIMPVNDIKRHDVLFGHEVVQSPEPLSGNHWRITAISLSNEKDFLTLVCSSQTMILVQRPHVLEPGQCKDCGRLNSVKYPVRHQCGACYQKERRANGQPRDKHSDSLVNTQ